MSRRPSRRKNCSRVDAKNRLIDAMQFFEASEILESADVVATNAIHAAIAAADVLTCVHLGERANGGDHASAAELLRKIDPNHALALKRALDRKTQASYESTDISMADAVRCRKWAKQLISEAIKLFPEAHMGFDA